MILTSHYMEDIERLCERIVLMRGGELVYDGPRAKLVSAYARHKVLTAHLRVGEVPAEGPARPEAGRTRGKSWNGTGPSSRSRWTGRMRRRRPRIFCRPIPWPTSASRKRISGR